MGYSFNDVFEAIIEGDWEHEAKIEIKGKFYRDGFSHEYGYQAERGCNVDKVAIVLSREGKTPVNIKYGKLRSVNLKRVDKVIDDFIERTY